MDLNLCVFTGRLTKDANKKVVAGDKKLVEFGLAVNTGWGDNARVLFLDCNLWGVRGDSVFEYLLKGKQVSVQGRLEVQKWQSKQTGQDCQKNVLQVNDIILLGGPRSEAAEEKPLAKDAYPDDYASMQDIPF